MMQVLWWLLIFCSLGSVSHWRGVGLCQKERSMTALEDRLRAAIAAHQQGKLPQAEQLYREILQNEPNHPDALHLLGVIAHQAGRPGPAIDLIRRAIVVNPQVAAFHSNLASALKAAGHLADAQASYQEAIRLDPNFADAHAQLGVLLRSAGDPSALAQAKSHLETALKINPKHPVALRNHALLLSEMGKIDEAIQALSDSLKVQPASAETHYALAELCAGNKRAEEAIVAYREAMRLNPRIPNIAKKLGIQLIRRGKFQEAVEVFDQAVRLEPTDADLHNNLGVAYKLQGKFVEAAVRFEMALKLNPNFAEVWNNLGSVRAEQERFEEAVTHFRKALELLPTHPRAQTNLGTAYRKVGSFYEAKAELNLALAKNPNDADAHLQMSEVCRQLGDGKSADAHYRQAIMFNPKLASRAPALPQQTFFAPTPKEPVPAAAGEANNRGMRLKNQGDLEGAILEFREALRIYPAFGLTMQNLAATLGDLERNEEALAVSQEALRLQPENAPLHNNVGVLLQKLGRLDEAKELYRKAVSIDPTLADAHNNLGAIAMHEKLPLEAIEHYHNALRHRPNYAAAHNNIGAALKRIDAVEEAIGHYREALRLTPDFPEATANLAYALLEEGEMAEAAECYRQMLRRNPNQAETANNLGYLCLELGQFEEALSVTTKALELRPFFGEAYCNLVDLSKQGRYRFEPELIQQMRDHVQSPALKFEDSGPIHFALAGLAEAEKKWDDAFYHYRQANEAKRLHFAKDNRAFDHDHCRAMFDRIIATFTKQYFRSVKPPGLDTEIPVFVVGMPRSGTTLVEQIIASHPQGHGAGELKQIQRMVTRMAKAMPGGDQGMTQRVLPGHVRQQAISHLAHLQRLNPTAQRIVDKMPDNFAHLEFIWSLYPNARIIHCRRDPIDTCLSCFVQNFRNITFATRLEDLAFYYQQYERLMNHWREHLPMRMYEVVYEELVENQETISKDLIRFLGLEWDDKCLDFHKNERPIQTASKLQVRQPIYKTSMKRWKRYEKHLQPLIDALHYTDDWGHDIKSGEVKRS
jgi:tetratricopeptide (TPR) repeat protein